MNDNANVNVSDKKDKEIEDLKKQLSAASASWTKYFKECETLKQELSKYKAHVKAQSAIINNN